MIVACVEQIQEEPERADDLLALWSECLYEIHEGILKSELARLGHER